MLVFILLHRNPGWCQAFLRFDCVRLEIWNFYNTCRTTCSCIFLIRPLRGPCSTDDSHQSASVTVAVHVGGAALSALKQSPDVHIVLSHTVLRCSVPRRQLGLETELQLHDYE